MGRTSRKDPEPWACMSTLAEACVGPDLVPPMRDVPLCIELRGRAVHALMTGMDELQYHRLMSRDRNWHVSFLKSYGVSV